jgi:hypothetical protein
MNERKQFKAGLITEEEFSRLKKAAINNRIQGENLNLISGNLMHDVPTKREKSPRSSGRDSPQLSPRSSRDEQRPGLLSSRNSGAAVKSRLLPSPRKKETVEIRKTFDREEKEKEKKKKEEYVPFVEYNAKKYVINLNVQKKS